MSDDDYGLGDARARLAALRDEIDALESEGLEIGEAALSRSTDLAKRALAVADDVISDAAAGTVGAAAAAVSGAADGMDETRDSIRATPIAAVLIALGIGVVLGHLTASRQAGYKSWF